MYYGIVKLRQEFVKVPLHNNVHCIFNMYIIALLHKNTSELHGYELVYSKEHRLRI